MREIPIETLQFNPFTRIADEWMLLTAGTEQHGYNTMTCSWGHLGAIWGHPTAVCYVRPQRYTREWMEREGLYTLSFFEGRKKELSYLGTHSGRNEDKVAATGLTPVFGEGTTWFQEASLVFVCRKQYRGALSAENFTDSDVITTHYPNRDFHDVYIGEIVKMFAAD